MPSSIAPAMSHMACLVAIAIMFQPAGFAAAAVGALPLAVPAAFSAFAAAASGGADAAAADADARASRDSRPDTAQSNKKKR